MGYLISVTIGMVTFILIGSTGAPIIGFFVGGFICFIPMIIKEREEKAKAVASFLEIAQKRRVELIEQHLSVLALKNQQTLVRDEYGVLDTSKWVAEIDYFIDKVLLADLYVRPYIFGVDTLDPNESLESLNRQADELIAKGQNGVAANVIALKMKAATEKSTARLQSTKRLITSMVCDYLEKEIMSDENSISNIDVDALDPIQFEHHCAELLNGSGWNARVTQASGDQGIDVIAKYGNVKAVFQCKKYSQPVGNGAVQEIIAGKAFEQAHVAAVVSNATYTPSAKQLAGTTGIYLLHYSQLSNFANQLGLVEEVQVG